MEGEPWVAVDSRAAWGQLRVSGCSKLAHPDIRNTMTIYGLQDRHCANCLLPLAVTVFMVRNTDFRALVVPTCEECAPEKDKASLAQHGVVTNCPGCGIQVTHDWRWLRRCCSESCARRLRRKRAQESRQQRPCTVCQAMFRPRRSDAEYCSSPCRQWAYRRRTA